MNRDEQASRRKRPGLLLRFLAFLVTLALVLGAVFLVLNYDKLNFDAVRRWFSYRSLERSDNGQAESFSYDGGNTNRFTPVGSDLLVCTENTIRLYSGSGSVYVDETVSLEHPAADSEGSRALVYDAGGQYLFAFSDRALAWDLTLDDDLSLLSATVNSAGYAAVTAEQNGYKGSVTVYDPSGASIMRLALSSSFIMDAAVSPDSKTLAVLTIGLEDGNFESRLSFYSMDESSYTMDEHATEPTPSAVCSLGNDVILDLRWGSGGVWCLGESGAALVSPSGERTASTDFTGRYLKEFSLEGDGFAAALVGKYRAGTSADLVVLAEDGESRSLPVEEQVLSLSAAGRYIAVLTADRLDIYTQDLTLYNTLEGTQSARAVLMRSDGSAMLIDSETARLYVPQ
mgnify:FL=1